MFKQNKTAGSPGKSNDPNTASINLIGAGTVIDGDIRSNGDIRIDGTVNGQVISKAKVVVGSTGLVEGDVMCQNADVSGTIKGKTTVSELLFLKSTAKVIGDIVTGKLVVEVGATFTGSCNMGPVIKDIKDGDQPTLSKEKSAI
ncbi:MAG: polymer-forming cytoskeletal protein [Bacteroidia bacterium]|jgi:cytoskeletal protein CcmA (bactofilin family)|nr:polymer-forming cytoskeletal protein [Bacteroidia bacterium]MBP7437200.1 polymer-forming cytoskeletal protein [Bacteroidia bacterium]MBP7728489.1 polymer-forming cytoskeletal protein [Bacteroidia bacterium]MBP7772464.1 polymer-forming cytoskeletal protein [Bacteroidia bacterium]HRI41311.1 polymer-forming cytoskeletal protein [Bacteroidia bacterium]